MAGTNGCAGGRGCVRAPRCCLAQVSSLEHGECALGFFQQKKVILMISSLCNLTLKIR